MTTATRPNPASVGSNVDLQLRLRGIVEDPISFCKLCWPEIRLYDRQVEVLYSVRDNPETFVHAANEVGKDFIASIAVVWFFASRSPCKVITTSSSESQLASVLWGEIKQRIVTSRFKLPFQVNHLLIRKVLDNGSLDPLSEILGKVAQKGESFQGFHLPHDKPRILVVLDEASGIDDLMYESAQSFAHRILAIGNPMNTTNFFYRCCKAGNQDDPNE